MAIVVDNTLDRQETSGIWCTFLVIFLACYRFTACVWDENMRQFCLSESLQVCTDLTKKMECSLFGKMLSGFSKHFRCAISLDFPNFTVVFVKEV
jgi:hypothetical protein